MIGALPWGLAAVQTGGSPLIQELAGSAIAGTSSAPWLLQPFQRLFNLALLGSTVIFGLRPPWAVSWLFLPLLPLALTFWLVVLAYIFRLVRSGAPYQPQARLLAGVIAALLTGFIFTSFGNDPSGRYFVPLAAPLALFAASLILALQTRAWKWAWLLALLIPAYHLAGTIQAARQFPPGLTTQFDAVTQVDQRDLPRVIEFLQAHGETYGYSNYWVAYPLAFFSQETLIYLPRLPYHQDFRYTERDDRYRPYRERVALAERVAYITTNHPALDERLRQGFSQAGINWQEETIGDFHIFYALSQVIHPQALGLGTTTTP
jgi:4-amino-4-deoxy-L-arabinose transferase-like glycosyltransferase